MVQKHAFLRICVSHVVLIGACLIVLFPVSRAISISFSDTGSLGLSPSEAFPKRGEATTQDYLSFFGNAFFPYDSSRSGETLHSSKMIASSSTDDDFGALDALDKPESHQRFWYSNYLDLFSKYTFVQWVYNSLIVSFTAAFLGLFLSSTAAYAFSRFDFPGRKIGLTLVMTSQMIPGPMLIIPIYLVVKAIGLGNTYTGYILALTVSTLPFALMILKGYFDSIPLSLEEAARVDGCGQISVFFKILLPLSMPILVIAFLFNFIAAWTEFILAATLIDDNELRTWPLGVMSFANNYDARWGIMCAACVLIAIPSVAMFLYSSKYMVKGITLGAVKG